jgi:hypothetical protein
MFRRESELPWRNQDEYLASGKCGDSNKTQYVAEGKFGGSGHYPIKIMIIHGTLRQMVIRCRKTLCSGYAGLNIFISIET